jgi:hypothetical protein
MRRRCAPGSIHRPSPICHAGSTNGVALSGVALYARSPAKFRPNVAQRRLVPGDVGSRLGSQKFVSVVKIRGFEQLVWHLQPADTSDLAENLWASLADKTPAAIGQGQEARRVRKASRCWRVMMRRRPTLR